MSKEILTCARCPKLQDTLHKADSANIVNPFRQGTRGLAHKWKRVLNISTGHFGKKIELKYGITLLDQVRKDNYHQVDLDKFQIPGLGLVWHLCGTGPHGSGSPDVH